MNFTKDTLWDLRQEISLGSLYTLDYENSYGVEPKECQSFFDSFIEYNEYERKDPDSPYYQSDDDWFYDNPEDLWNFYAYMFEEEPLPITELKDDDTYEDEYDTYWDMENERNSERTYKTVVKYKLFKDDNTYVGEKENGYYVFEDTYYIDSGYSLDEVENYIIGDALLVCGGGYNTKNIKEAIVEINGKVVYELDRTNDTGLSESKNRGKKKVKESVYSFDKSIEELIDGGYESALNYLRAVYLQDITGEPVFYADESDVSNEELIDYFAGTYFVPEDFEGNAGDDWSKVESKNRGRRNIKKINESKGNYIDFGELSDLLDKYGIGIQDFSDVSDTVTRITLDKPYTRETAQAERELTQYANVSRFGVATNKNAPEIKKSYFYFTYPDDELEESYGRKNEAVENEYGEKLYRVYVRTGTAWNDVREVYAYDEQEAIDKVVDRLEKEESNLVMDYYEIYDMCEYPETVDEFAEANDLICAGNHGLYIGIDRIELVED